MGGFYPDHLKIQAMSTYTTQQEILLFTHSSFFRRELAGLKEGGQNRFLKTAREQLKEGCWNGILGDLLPEIVQTNEQGRPLFLWNVYDGSSFLGIELGELLQVPEAEYSLNPQAWLTVVSLS